MQRGVQVFKGYAGTSEQISRDMLFGRLRKIHVKIHKQAIAPELIGDYQFDREFRVKFQHHLNQIWLQKDQQLAVMMEQNGVQQQKACNTLT